MLGRIPNVPDSLPHLRYLHLDDVNWNALRRGVRVTAHHLEATPAICWARQKSDELERNTVKCYCGPVTLESSASFH